MSIIKFLKLLLLLFITTNLLAQNNNEDLILNKIEFTGLKKTKEVYLNDILRPVINQATPLSKIKSDLQILKNLPSVASADFTIDTIGQTIQVNYTITERRTALPIINFGGIKNNIWFTVGAVEDNFRGYGDSFLFFYQNNQGRHSGQIFFRKPRILNTNWGYSLTVNKWSSVEPVFFTEETVQYDYDNNSIGASILRNFGLNDIVELGGTYFVESFNKQNISITTSPGPDGFRIKKFLTKLELKRNRINYHYFYLKGFETSLNYQNVLSLDENTAFNEKTAFNSLKFEGKFFSRPKEKLNLAVRIKLAISTNNDSPFAPFVADSHVNIRGIGNRIDRGTAQAVLNIEGRYTLHHRENWSSQLVVFTDSGTWRDPGGDLKDIFDSEKFRQFVGAGFRVNLKKIFGASIRVDYGVDLYDLNQRGFVLGLGQYY